MALALRYPGVGTSGYLINSRTGKRVFLEINPVYKSSIPSQRKPRTSRSRTSSSSAFAPPYPPSRPSATP
ncbi:hypothetical protein FIBSPDRAFT_862369 [Athelia psychrophila]|uniref:Carbamoyl-phosphate synthetase large subunit-like ATP-binding domain-containing protein n=1 Tax=Athelia psychrophila TaxID=1759441 RepID=A0A166ICK1_9AGAM|nr:hypothetical protein FIBSPDRAFT_862369 [Fibularhizoctonia sp. CBS 109695]